MDILKLLSRSTKRGKSLGAQNSGNIIPSAGGAANPQLFHDKVRGKKRKRTTGDDETQARLDPEIEEDIVDFFAPKRQVSKTTKDDGRDALEPAQTPPVKLLSEEESRQVLRSHRLKIALLSSQIPPQKERKAKRSKRMQEVKPSTKLPSLTPQPLEKFSDLRHVYHISKRLGENLAAQGFKIPTEVQLGSLPLLLDPRVALRHDPAYTQLSDINLLTVAPTGSGKSLAFLLPAINDIIRARQSNTETKQRLHAIVVAPTKELASQIFNEGKKLSLGTGVRVTAMRKGMQLIAQGDKDQSQQTDNVDEAADQDEGDDAQSSEQAVKADILVTTPQVLLNAIETHTLPTVKLLILDEADVLLDPLFRDQTLGIWNACVNPALRVTLWSATMGSNIESLAVDTIKTRLDQLQIKTPSNVVRLVVGLKDSAIPNITHHLTYAATEPGKLIALRQLLHPTSSANSGIQALRPPFLVFTQTIPRAVALHAELLYDIPSSAGGSSRIAVLHSDLTDPARDAVMTRFRNSEIWVLITTDILARGVDFRGINGVVNYDVPNSAAAYIHRVGRTGRAGRNGGVAVTFYTKEDIPYVKNVANIIAASEKQAGKPAGEAAMQKWLLDALPTPSKRDKQRLKKFGVEARRGGLEKGKLDKKESAQVKRMQISTKSGYERRLENKKRGAIQGSQRRQQQSVSDPATGASEEWGGFD